MVIWLNLLKCLEAGGLIALGLFSLHRVWLLGLRLRYSWSPPRPLREFTELPVVTIQLPTFNERYVIGRLLDAVTRLDYPRDRLEIQVLDDSTDDTTALIAQRVAALHAQGFRILHLHRSHRTGFKAGALAQGLTLARGEFIALFDADFVPTPDFLRRTIHHLTDARVGMVQARWGHLNRNDSFLTRAQALMLDGHFLIEQVARSRAGHFFNFNGTAGVWRTQTILDAGGWRADTLTEDLDLSYRAQLKGWRFVYLKDLVVPAELLMRMGALKAQQHRWTKGSIQTAIKLFPQLLRSKAHWPVKLEACFHLGNWLHYPMALLLAVLILPALMIAHSQTGIAGNWAWEGLVSVLLISTMAAFYGVAHQQSREPWWRFVTDLPVLMAITAGLALNNTRAVLEAFRGVPSTFHRTPKYNGHGAAVRRPGYRGHVRGGTWGLGEVGLGVYVCATLTYAASQALYSVVPFLVPLSAGFLYAGFSALLPRLTLFAEPRPSWRDQNTPP